MSAVPIQIDAPPLRVDEDGTMRVGKTRVILDLVIHAFQDGATAEEICQRYPTLNLADVYGVIAYYLRHREDIEQYLADREKSAHEVFEKIRARQGDLGDIRARLLSRMKAR